jgi:hypothetical protein
VPNRLHGRVGTFGTLCRNPEQSEPIWDLQAKFKFHGPPAEANFESRRYRTYLMKTIFDVASSAWNNPHDEIHSVKRSHASPNMSILRLCATFLRLEILRSPRRFRPNVRVHRDGLASNPLLPSARHHLPSG